MTTKAGVWEVLERRGLDVELASKMGLNVQVGAGGAETLVISFARRGVIAGRKYRRFDGEPKWRAEWAEHPIAWNEDVLLREDLYGQPLIITEGELDALAAIQAGFERTISPPNGCAGATGSEVRDDAAAFRWLREIQPRLTLESAPQIILATDGDEAGSKLLHDLQLALGPARCKFLTYPKTRRRELGRERCKDLNEVLQEYGLAGVVKTVQRAAWVESPGVYRMSELPPLPPEEVFEPSYALFRSNYKIRLGDLVVITGVPGFGKTTFVNDFFCRAARDHGLNVAWASFEQEPQRDHRRAMRRWHGGDQAAADAWIDERHVFITPSLTDEMSLEWLLDRLETAAVRFRCKIMVVDPWNEMEHVRDRSETQTEYTGRAIRTLKRFAKRFKVHLAIVAHPAKMQRNKEGKYPLPSLYDIADSSHFYNKPDLGLVIHRDDEGQTRVIVQKSRYHDVIGRPGEVLMRFDEETRRFREIQRVA